MREDERELLITPREAARRCSVSVDFFRDWIQPNLKVVRVGKGQRLLTLIPPSELEKWAEKNAMVVGR